MKKITITLSQRRFDRLAKSAEYDQGVSVQGLVIWLLNDAIDDYFARMKARAKDENRKEREAKLLITHHMALAEKDKHAGSEPLRRGLNGSD